MKEFTDNHRIGETDISVNCHWRSIKKYETDDIHKIDVLSFDLECTSCDGGFPQPERPDDYIFQIGMTLSKLGETECYRKILLCMKETDPIDGVEVYCFDTEKELILAFRDWIIKTDPDFITGYNINGFDWRYLNVRAKKYHIESKFSRMSRIKNHECEYTDDILQSSALGKNRICMYKIPGRGVGDLYKIIQRDHKFSSYKLDAVTGIFITDKIKNYTYHSEGSEEYLRLKQICMDYNEIGSGGEKNEKNNYLDVYESDDEDDDGDDDLYLMTLNTNKKYEKLMKKNKIKKKKVGFTVLDVKSTKGIKINDYVHIKYNNGAVDNPVCGKKRIIEITDTTITVEGKVRVRPFLQRKWKIFWCQAKDNIEPKDIFESFNGDSNQRSKIGKYCVKDCSLCNRLVAKLQILPNNIGMGNVCSVPLSYIFLRGQGIKIYSLAARECRKENYLIPTKRTKYKKKPVYDEKGKLVETEEEKEAKRMEKFINALNGGYADEEEDDSGYEGATVFVPDSGLHLDPVIVDDYGSLYPSSMIMKNLSHETIVLDDAYDNLPGYKYHEQTYNNNDGTTTTCKFAERLDGRKGIVPRILMGLLGARKKYKKLKAIETNPFKKAVWDGLQLAYKVTANSLYGQTGSTFSAIYLKHIAACTTSIGRDMLVLAEKYVEDIMPVIFELIRKSCETGDDTDYLKYMHAYYSHVKNENVKGKEYDGKNEFFQHVKEIIYPLIKDFILSPKCVYGDTDSVFYKLNMKYKDQYVTHIDKYGNEIKTNKPFRDHDSLKTAITLGIITSHIVNYTLDFPQVLEYEKTYWPLILISKKRYVGNLYEEDPNEYKQKSMGLETKRRDKAGIVKVILGGIIDQMLNKHSAQGAVDFVEKRLERVITGEYDFDKFVLSKTLKDKEDYSDWTTQPHMIVADRMTQRDPGNKPQSNDRLPYIFIEPDYKIEKQCEAAEHPDYARKNNCKVDYLFYITNHIMKPAIQFLELIVDNPQDLFTKYIIREENRKNGTQPIMFHLNNNLKCDSKDVKSSEIVINFGSTNRKSYMKKDIQKIRKLKEEEKAKSRRKRKKKQINHFEAIKDKTSKTMKNTKTKAGKKTKTKAKNTKTKSKTKSKDMSKFSVEKNLKKLCSF